MRRCRWREGNLTNVVYGVPLEQVMNEGENKGHTELPVIQKMVAHILDTGETSHHDISIHLKQ